LKERNEWNIVTRTPYWVKWHINPTKAKQINQCFLSLTHYLTSGWLIFVLTTNRLLRHCHPFFTFVLYTCVILLITNHLLRHYHPFLTFVPYTCVMLLIVNRPLRHCHPFLYSSIYACVIVILLIINRL
jgi:hypothetical protein